MEFATKPALAKQMLIQALDHDAAARWVAGDEVYGADPGLRRELEQRGVGYVLAVACNHQVVTGAGRRRADAIAASLPKRAWQRLSAGQGSKGPRVYDWAWVSIDATAGNQPGQRWLLIRRNTRTGELAYYRCYAPRPVPLGELVRAAGRRWTVEESFQAGKGLTGLDQHQVRRWVSWHRWTVLAMLAYAFLAVLAATERTDHPAPRGLISLTCNEIHHLFNVLTMKPISDLTHRLRWSTWRRRHQHRAKPATTSDEGQQSRKSRSPAAVLAGRPYDLRHACASTWLNAGVAATRVAQWLGHSVEALLRVYAKCIDGHEGADRKRIERFMSPRAED